MKKTPWFSHKVKPARLGVYEARAHSDDDGMYYARWDGGQWMAICTTPANAQVNSTPALWQDKPWRGLAQKP